jgi:PhnB protein
MGCTPQWNWAGTLREIRCIMKTNYRPQDFHSITPLLTVKDVGMALDFYKRAFGARERMRMPLPDGNVGHAELQIGDSVFMLGGECPERGGVSPQTLEGSPVGLGLYVENVDAAFERAVKAGATVNEAVDNKFWGDRAGSITDPFGHRWMLLTHIEDVPPQEMQRRMAEAFSAASAVGRK